MTLKSPPAGARILAATLLTLLGATVAVAADPTPGGQTWAPSKEMREKMATLHEQMAACLRSDKTFTECRTEMMKSCSATIGTRGCPMMGLGRGMRGGMGMRRGGMGMGAPPAPAAGSQPSP